MIKINAFRGTVNFFTSGSNPWPAELLPKNYMTTSKRWDHAGSLRINKTEPNLTLIVTFSNFQKKNSFELNLNQNLSNLSNWYDTLNVDPAPTPAFFDYNPLILEGIYLSYQCQHLSSFVELCRALSSFVELCPTLSKECPLKW